MKPLTFDEWYRNARVGDFSPEGCSRAAWEAGQKQAESERDALRLRVAALEAGLRKIDALALRQARAEGMERAARICHALNLTLEYTGQPLQDCISNRIRAEAAKLTGKE